GGRLAHSLWYRCSRRCCPGERLDQSMVRDSLCKSCAGGAACGAGISSASARGPIARANANITMRAIFMTLSPRRRRAGAVFCHGRNVGLSQILIPLFVLGIDRSQELEQLI